MALNRTPFTVTVGKEINKRRKAQGLRTMELAVRLDTSQITVERHLRGDTMLNAEQVAQYAALLGCSSDDLLPQMVKQDSGEWVARPKGLEPLTFCSDVRGPGDAVEQVAA